MEDFLKPHILSDVSGTIIPLYLLIGQMGMVVKGRTLKVQKRQKLMIHLITDWSIRPQMWGHHNLE